MDAPKMGKLATEYAAWDQEWIGPAAIRGLKQLLANKLGDRDAKERAAVFADALHRMVQSRMPALSESEKVTLRLKLVQVLCSEKGRITDRDVLEESLRLHPLSDEGFAALSDWVEARTGSKPAVDELKHWALQIRHNGTRPDMAAVKLGRAEHAAALASVHQADTAVAAIRDAADANEEAVIPMDRSRAGKALKQIPATTSTVTQSASARRLSPWFRHAAAAGLFLALFGFGAALLMNQQDADTRVLAEGRTSSPQPVLSFLPAAPPSPLMENGLPREYQHMYVNTEQLQIWLTRKRSMLAEEPYYTTMLDTAKNYNFHPYLLFAVAGQENGYVQTDHPNAEKIANNPFNVYHSWWEYNTDITDSSRIAAKTIVRLSWDQPADIHPFQWINREYAEDPNWWKGVKAIFQQMERDIPLAAPK